MCPNNHEVHDSRGGAVPVLKESEQQELTSCCKTLEGGVIKPRPPEYIFELHQEPVDPRLL
jgi:hypothetical protein